MHFNSAEYDLLLFIFFTGGRLAHTRREIDAASESYCRDVY